MNNENAPKERRKWTMHYMAKHVGAKCQIVQLAGQKYLSIYIARNYVEVSKEEYDKLHAEIRASWAK